MASIDAQINLILKGVSELKKLSSALDEIENTANSIQDLFGRGVFGRVSDINTYIKALGQIEKTAAATRLQAAAIADVNSETKRALIVESQLRRERSRTARLSRAFEIETKGLDQTKGKLKEIKEQFDEVSVALKSAFKLGDVKIISQLRNELSALVEDQREWNRTLAGTKNTGVNADFLKEQARGYAQQIEQLRKRALALSKNEEIIRRIAAAEFNLVKQRDKNTGAFTQFADPRLGRELLSNIKAQITAEEQLARERERFSGQYERQQKEARRQAISTAQTIAAIARKAGGATFDALTFGQGAKVARGARNAAIRGGLGLGALGLGGAYAATQEALGNINLGPIQGPAVEAANAIGGAINNALGGVPAIINDMLSALGNVPGSLGLASVAALAFAPAMKTAADAVFLAGKSFGETKFGENIKLTLDRQTNLFESVINKASEMNMVLGASRSGLDAVGKKIETLPALPAAGQTAFAGPMRRGRGGAFIGGGARELLSPEFLATATGAMAQRTQEAADTSLLFAEGLGQAATEAKTIAEYLKQANELRAKGESSTQRFIRQTIERGRIATQGRQSAEIARERSAFLTGSPYSLSQVPARGELFPGGRTETAQSAYRELLNTTARINQLQQDLLEKMSKQQGFSATIGQLERRTINDKGRSLAIQQQENEELQRSIRIIRERNKELRQRPIAAMTPQERVSQGILDPKSLRANRERRIEIGRLDPLERFYAGFQPRRLAARSARATSEGLVGGAFPLLFGQGIGAAALGGLGGAAGGFAGGGLGFGLSLVGTALGTAFDEAVQGAKELGSALRSPVESFQLLKDRSLLSSRAIERQAQALIDAGRAAEASALIQEDLNRRLGPTTVNGLKDLSSASDELARATAGSTAQLQLFIANMIGLGPILRGLASGARINELQARTGNVIAELQQQGKTAEAAQLEEVFGRTRFTEITPEQYAQQLNAALEKAEKSLKPVEIKTDDSELKKQLDTEIANADRVRALRQQGVDLERNAQDLRQNIEESILGLRKRGADLERESVEFRRSVEDQVFSKRQDLERKLIENDRIRQQNAIDAFDLQLQKASVGLDPIAQSVVDAARQYLKVRAEGEAELQQNEKQLRLELQSIDQETSRYKLQVEDRVAQMTIQRDEFTRDVAKTKLQLERSIGDYVVKVEEYRLAMAKHRYDLELDLEKKKQIAAQGGLTGGGGPVDRLMGAAAQREKFVQDQLVRRGFTPEQMAAVMGSIRQESGFNPYAKEQDGTGLGLFQWSFGRRNKVPGFTGNWQQDITNQLDLFQRELNSTEAKAGQMLMSATTLQGAAAGMKQFERYGVAGRRYDYMQDYYKKFTGGAGAPVSQQMEPGFTETFDLNAPAPVAPTAPEIPGMPSAPQLAGVNDLLERYLGLQQQIKAAIESNNQALARKLQIESDSAKLAFEQQLLSPVRQFQEQNRELQFEIDKRQVRNRLLMEGVKPEIVEGELRVLEINKALNSALIGLEVATNEQIKAELKRLDLSEDLVDSTFRLSEATIADLIATTQDTEKQEQLRQKLQEILDLRNKLSAKVEGGAGVAAAGARDIAAQEAQPGRKIEDFIAQATAELNDLDSYAIRVSQSISDSISTGFTDAAMAIAGIGTLQEKLQVEDQIKQYERLKSEYEGLSAAAEAGSDAQRDYTDKIEEYSDKIKEARAEMDMLKDTSRELQEVAAAMLKGIADALVEQGAKMIATYIAIGIAKMFAGLAAGASSGSSSTAIPSTGTPAAPTVNGFDTGSIANIAANGAYFDGGMAYFANGGIVSSPTLFQFADGGVTQTGVMGEAGPEAIMPLERGPDGKLGVSAKLSGAMSRYSRPPGAAGGPEGGSGDSASTGGGAAVATAPIDVRYTVERINSVDYVTADQFRAGMAQAAQQGAKQGEQSTLRRLQQSSSTRRRLGM